MFACDTGNTGERVTKMVEAINVKCPAMVDEETMLKHVSYDKNKTLVYTFGLVHVLKENVDTAGFRKAVWPGLLSNIKVDRQMQDLREKDFVFIYAYQDSKGHPICEIRVKPEHYLKP